MSSDVEISNIALTKLGAQPIVSFLDSSKEGRVAQRTYMYFRDELLTKYSWNFCRQYALLPALANAPIFRYNFSYALPDDFLSLENLSMSGPNDNGIGLPGVNLADYIGDMSQAWQLCAGNIINTNVAAPAKLIYFARITDPNQYANDFIVSLACYLAWQWALTLTGSGSIKQACAQEFQMSINDALGNDSIQNAPRSIGDDTFMAARLGT